jgi:NhaP-type Na+/H+ or K+/H+ antiporter
MNPSVPLQLAALVVIGFAAQWLAWRVRLPAILFLLLIGLVLGPGLGWLHPQAAMGELFFPFISFGVAIILFEGSSNLRFSELREVGGTILRLVSVGALVTLAVLAAAAHWIAGMSWELAALFGALTCVTGPTVVAPMLRAVRPNARIANVLRWEGIVIDPLGAMFAVLTYEAIVSHQGGHALAVFGATILVGTICGALGAMVLAFLLRHHWLPEYLQTFAALALVLATFALSNEVAHESGLLAVTIMGITLGNLRGLAIGEILSFKEHLSTLLISALFILLAARLSWPLLEGALGAGLAILLVALFIARPLSVWAGSVGGNLSWRERTLLAWFAPRGIVAAAVSSLFALRLEEQGLAGAELLVPLTFAVIIGTVAVQSATARPLARFLGVAAPEPDGVLVVGSHRVARTLASALHEQGVKVVLADDDWFDIRAARMSNLPTWYGDPVSEHATRTLNLDGLGQLFAMSARRELNGLACVRYRSEFGRHHVFRLRVLPRAQDGNGRRQHDESIRAPRLFGNDVTLTMLEDRLQQGWRIKTTRLSKAFDLAAFHAEHGADALPLFSVDEQKRTRVATEATPLPTKPGWSLTALVAPRGDGAVATAT